MPSVPPALSTLGGTGRCPGGRVLPSGAVGGGGVVGAALAAWSLAAVLSLPVLAVVNVWLPLTAGDLPKVSPKWRDPRPRLIRT